MGLGGGEEINSQWGGDSGADGWGGVKNTGTRRGLGLKGDMRFPGHSLDKELIN